MSLSRFLLGSAVVALIGATAPSAAGAQGSWKTACNDGSTTNATGANACDGHGGIHKVNSTILHRAPARTAHPSVPARVTQAGTPAPAPAAKPKYEEHHGGWRWKRHHEEKREERREERREEKHRRVRCRDGRYETVEGKAKGRDVCKHHGGMAH
jgi:hypothetical protein